MPVQFLVGGLGGFPGGSNGKESACSAGDPGSIPGSGRSPGEGKVYSSIFMPGEFHGQGSLPGYSPWDQKKELNTTERLDTLMHLHGFDYSCFWTWFTVYFLIVYLPCSLLISLTFPPDTHIHHIYFTHFPLHWFGTLLFNSVPSVILISS